MDANQPKKLGRPTKYDPKYDEMLIEHMAQGLSFEAFAGLIEVNVDSLKEWDKVHPSFSAAKKVAFSKCRLFWEKLATDNPMSSRDGSLNTGLWVFNMKNRFKWTDRMELAGDEAKPITIGYNPKDL